MRPGDKLPRALALGLLLPLLAGCLFPPVRERVQLDLRGDGGVLVTTELRISSDKDFSRQERALRRIDQARRDAAEERDAWSRRLERLGAIWDERTVERHEGRIVRVTRRSLLDDFRRLEDLFRDTDVDCEVNVEDESVELVFLPGVSRRATSRQREAYEPLEKTWIEAAARYFTAMDALYGYLERHPERAAPCLAPLLDGWVVEEELEDLEAPNEDEASLVEEAKLAADEVQNVFLVPEELAYTVNELSSLVHDPFPAPLGVRVPGEVLLVEGFRESEGLFEVRGPSLWNAWRAIGEERLDPDPVREKWERARSEIDEKFSLAVFAARPRRAEAIDARELESLVRERLEPPSILRIRWSVSPPEED